METTTNVTENKGEQPTVTPTNETTSTNNGVSAENPLKEAIKTIKTVKSSKNEEMKKPVKKADKKPVKKATAKTAVKPEKKAVKPNNKEKNSVSCKGVIFTEGDVVSIGTRKVRNVVITKITDSKWVYYTLKNGTGGDRFKVGDFFVMYNNHVTKK